MGQTFSTPRDQVEYCLSRVPNNNLELRVPGSCEPIPLLLVNTLSQSAFKVRLLRVTATGCLVRLELGGRMMCGMLTNHHVLGYEELAAHNIICLQFDGKRMNRVWVGGDTSVNFDWPLANL